MDTFEWSSIFETGLSDVDHQHRQLVDLVNQLANDTDSGNAEQIDKTIDALVSYTQYHFQCEENIMRTEGIADAHVRPHCEAHRRFIVQVGEWLDRHFPYERPICPNLMAS